MKTCCICSEEYEPKNKKQTNCRSDECKKEYQRQYYIKKHGERTCATCSKPFVSSQPQTKTCGKVCAQQLREKQKRERVCPDIAEQAMARVKNKFLLAY